MNRVLVITPHCDDETYGLGGTILKRIKAGDELYVTAVCAGEINFEHAGVISRVEREKEFLFVLKTYKCSGELLSFTQESLLDTIPTRDIVDQIQKIQDKFQANVWYIPGESYHQDHRKVFEACAAAARPTRKYIPKEIYSYEHPLYSWNPPTWRFTPQVYENIGEFLDKKIEICKLYKTQLRDGPLSIRHIKDYSIACGTEAGMEAAERFEVIRILR